MEFEALLIPASDFRDVEVITITKDEIRDYVGGWPKRTRYDSDTAFFCNEIQLGLPKNRRASDYVKTESDAARGRADHLDNPNVLYGDVIVVGYTAFTEELKDIPDRLVTHTWEGLSFPRRREDGPGHIPAPWDILGPGEPGPWSRFV